MPNAPLKPCSQPGCPELTNSRYCQRHTKARMVYKRYGKYNTKEWREKRKQVLEYQPFCQCGEPTTEVDHKIPLRDGGSDDYDNLQGMCKECHSRKTAKETGWLG